MKISNSKKQLAKIIHENGGWRDGMSFSWYGNKTKMGYFGEWPPRFDKASGSMIAYGALGVNVIPFKCEKLPNWHQTILSRDEYSHLYPAPDAMRPEDFGAVDDCGLPHGSKPTIEQLAAEYRNRKDYADRKQQEADAAKADAEAKLAELVAAGKAHGLVLSVAGPEPELVITDWRDLQVGDEVALTAPNGGGVNVGEVGVIRRIDGSSMSVNFPSQTGHLISRSIANWMFIRRPSKGEANA